MHKQHEDQPSNELPNLSTWHRVPVGAVIPANTPYAYTYKRGLTAVLAGNICSMYVGDCPYYTEKPIAPPLPTEEGARILASSDERLPPHILLTRQGGLWVSRYGSEWSVDQITSWAPVTIGEVVVMP